MPGQEGDTSVLGLASDCVKSAELAGLQGGPEGL